MTPFSLPFAATCVALPAVASVRSDPPADRARGASPPDRGTIAGAAAAVASLTASV